MITKIRTFWHYTFWQKKCQILSFFRRSTLGRLSCHFDRLFVVKAGQAAGSQCLRLYYSFWSKLFFVSTNIFLCYDTTCQLGLTYMPTTNLGRNLMFDPIFYFIFSNSIRKKLWRKISGATISGHGGSSYFC